MADSSTMKDLVVKLTKNGQLELRPIRFVTGAFDVVALFTHNGQTHEGRGTAFDDNTAIFKATAEALERCYLVENEIQSSNGWAVRESPLQAMFSAHAEAIERDLFAAHLLASHPFFRAPKLENAVTQKLPNIEFYELRRVTTFRVTIAVGTLTNGGIVVGLGSNADVQASLNQAFVECARNVLAWEFDQTSFRGPKELAATPEYGEKFRAIFVPESGTASATEAEKENTLDLMQPVFQNATYALNLPEPTGLTIAHAKFEGQFNHRDFKNFDEARLAKIFNGNIKAPFNLGQPLG